MLTFQGGSTQVCEKDIPGYKTKKRLLKNIQRGFWDDGRVGRTMDLSPYLGNSYIEQFICCNYFGKQESVESFQLPGEDSVGKL